MILYQAWPLWMQQAQTILSPYTYTGGTAYYPYYLPQQIALSPAAVVLGARNQMGMPPLSFSLLFPVCLLLAILLLWAGCKLFDQLSVEAWRQTFTLRGFALALLLFVWLSLAWLAAEIASEVSQDAQMMTMLHADRLLHSTSLPVATAWPAFIFWFAFAVGLIVQWLVWRGIRYLLRRRARLPVAA